MARVPLQQTPQVGLEVGSAPQFTGGRIEPVQDTVTDDIQRFSKAQRNVADIAIKLQEEYNDAEALKLSNEVDEEIEKEKNNYVMTQGVNAVATVNKDKGETVYDTAINNINTKFAEIGEKASNSQIKFLYENMASVKIKSATSEMTKHSIKQQRKYLEAETTAAIDNHKKATKQSYTTWQDPEGAFKLNYIAGIQRINEKALQKGWNLDPENGPISSQYIKELNEYNMDIFKDVIKKFDDDKNFAESKAFRESLNPMINQKEIQKIKVISDKKHNNHLTEKIVNSVLANNANQNDGQFLSHVNKLSTLDSNNNIDNNNGGSVDDGFNSNDELIDTTGNLQTENIELLEKIKNQSKFYDPETTTRLIPEHQPTHLFAIQRLGVKKADSLYTKAKSLYPIDQRAYKENPKYAEAINKKIIDNYNKLIVEEANKIYGRFGDGEYAITVANDLEVIKQGIDYNYKFTDKEPNIDPVTNLRPIKELKQELKDTIKDPDKLKFAIEDLEIKYNKIKNTTEGIYNQALNDAKQIAFAEPGGWKNLTTNGIDINNFKKEDQELLKKGQPVNSDEATVAVLKDNPIEIRDNIDSYSHLLSKGQYIELKRYQQELKGENKILAATGDVKTFKDVLNKHGFSKLAFPKEKLKGDEAAEYNALFNSWEDRIDYAQRIENRKLSRTEKEKLLMNVLLDKVNVGKKYKQDVTFATVIEKEGDDKLDKTSVLVKVKRADGNVVDDRIFNSDIPPEINISIMAALYRRKSPMSQQQIAQLWQNMGRPETLKEANKYIRATENYKLLTMEE